MGAASFCFALECGWEAKDRADSWTGLEKSDPIDAPKKLIEPFVEGKFELYGNLFFLVDVQVGHGEPQEAHRLVKRAQIPELLHDF